MKRVAVAVASSLLLSASAVRAAPSIPLVDRVRIAEAFQLADSLGERLWSGWSRAPLALLLITPEREFLIRHPKPSPDFTALGQDSVLKTGVWARPRQFDPHLLATFAAVGGVPTIVIGQAESTMARSSTPWVLTLLHEHFHQLQYSRPDYNPKVIALGLQHGDSTGMWMLNYPFPYTKPEVKQQFARLCAALDSALHAQSPESFKGALGNYLDAKRGVRALVSADDYKYFTFQLWQEGIARYTEVRMASLAAQGYSAGASFQALPDYRAFKDQYARALSRIDRELAIPLDDAQRTAFYAIGAGEGLLLDRIDSQWRSRYFEQMFSLDQALAGH